MTKVRVLSLNCWGLPWTCEYNTRIFKIIDGLAKSDYDIVILQEIFIQKDIDTLMLGVMETYPYFHYFYGGIVGTGIVILSRFKITAAISFPFNQSGMIYHSGGDWFARKSLCYAVINHPDRNIHVFGCHTHAKYPKNEHNNLRTLQLFQIAQTLKLLTRDDDAVILTGDFNTENFEPAFKFLLNFCSLKDSCYEVHDIKSDSMFTCNAPGNSYSSQRDRPNRIDYILYNGLFTVKSFKFSFEKIEGTDLNYSDHNGIEATLEFNNKNSFKEEVDRGLLEEVYDIIVQGQNDSVFPVYFSSLFIVFIILLLFLLSFIDFGIIGRGIIMAGFGIFTLSIILYLTFFISLRQQRRIFKNVANEIKILKQGLN